MVGGVISGRPTPSKDSSSNSPSEASQSEKNWLRKSHAQPARSRKPEEQSLKALVCQHYVQEAIPTMLCPSLHCPIPNRGWELQSSDFGRIKAAHISL